MSKTAIITGITGQTGSYLADSLLEKGYKVYGLKRRSSSFNTERIDHLYTDLHQNNQLELVYGDLSDYSSLLSLIADTKADFFFNMAAQSHVRVSFDIPEYTMDVTGTGVLRCLEAIRKYSPATKFLQSSSSVSGDTNVLIKKNGFIQLVEIESLTKNKERTEYSDLECLTIDDNFKCKWSKVAYVFKHKSNNIYKLKGSGGLDMTITGNHSVIVLNSDLELVEKKVEDLSINDTLLSFTQKENFNNKPYPTFDLLKYKNNEKYITRSNPQINSLEINDDIMRFIGYYLAEGDIYIDNYKINFTFHIKEKYYTDDIINIIKNNFGEFHCYEQEIPEFNTRKLSICSKQLSNFILENFKTGSYKKVIPSWMWEIPKSGFLNLLRGYIGDARIRSKNEICYTSVNKNLIESICYIGKLNGMDSRISKRFNKEHLSPQNTIIKSAYCYDLIFSGENADEILSVKNNRKKFKNLNSNCLDIKILEKIHNNIYKKYKNSNKKSFGKNKIKTNNDKLFKLLNSPIHVVKIKSIEKIDKDIDVYDLHVPETQRFIGGNYPILLHNSEMFGATPPPQSESTPFHPRSPYAVAKVAGYYSTINYREAYNLFACNTICFNHECLSSNTPLIVRKNGIVDVVSAKDLIPLRKNGPNVQTFILSDVEIWDGGQWTELKTVTATKHNPNNKDQKLLSIQARAGIVEATSHHNMLDENFKEKRTDNFIVGDKVALASNFPEIPSWSIMTEEMAEFLGYMVSDGCISCNKAQFTNNDEDISNRVSKLWSKLFLGTTYLWYGVSGFNKDKKVRQLRLNGNSLANKWIKEQIYNSDNLKIVPKIILNSNINVQKAFIKGYYAGDGLKAGSGESIKTNSSFLAQGLCWIYYNLGNYCSTYAEHKNGSVYYQLNILKKDNKFGNHLKKEPSEVRKIEDAIIFDDWVFDVETGSSVLMAGVGRVMVHNSPRRSETFVTRKITRAATRIKLGLQSELYLGNLEAKRDWGHAKDYAEAMIKILESDSPDDYVVSTGQMYSVKDFVIKVFDKLNLDWSKYVKFDPKYLRPTEVDALQGDCSKIKSKLNWKPKYSFDDLVNEMVESDLELARKEKLIKDY